MKYLLLWPLCGLLAFAIILYELRKCDATLTELVEYLQSQNKRRPIGKKGIVNTIAIIVALGPISLTHIVLDAIQRRKP